MYCRSYQLINYQIKTIKSIRPAAASTRTFKVLKTHVIYNKY